MAKTQIADVVVPRIMRPYIQTRTAERARLFASGIIRTDEELDIIASAEAGKTFDLPFWPDLSGDSEELSDSGALTPAKRTADKDTAVKHFRGKAWEANELAKHLAGSDPMANLADLLVDFWNRDMQKKVLIPSLTGIFAGPLAATHVHDISLASAGTQTDANRISSDACIDAGQKLGDAWSSTVAIAMHSTVCGKLRKLGLITTESLKDQDLTVERFLGREVIEDDNVDVVPAAAGVPAKYSCYLFGQGAIGYGDGGPGDDNEYLETYRAPLSGDDGLISRRHFILHPRGVAFTGTVAGVTPTSTELATGGNWTRKWEVKQIPIVKLVVNA